jgi:ketosteroid isomerase-like protein
MNSNRRSYCGARQPVLWRASGAVAAFVLAVAVLSGTTSSQSDAPAIDAAARTTIAKANAGWMDAMKRQDLAAIVEPYEDGAIFVTATGESVRGRGAIEQLMRERFAKSGRVTGGRIVQDGIASAGTMVYEWGHADLEVAAQGQPPAASRGRYLTVWRKDAAGGWRIARNLSLSN